MSLMELTIQFIGVPNDPVGWVVVICFASALFIMLVEMLTYGLWKFSTALG